MRLILAVLMLLPTALFAQSQNCRTREAVTLMLIERYGESARVMGVIGTAQIVEFFASDESGSWTIIVSRPNGMTCIVASGEHFQMVEPRIPGVDG